MFIAVGLLAECECGFRVLDIDDFYDGVIGRDGNPLSIGGESNIAGGESSPDEELV